MTLLWNPNWRPPPSWILVRWHFWSGIPIYGGILYLLTECEPSPLNLGKVMAIFFAKSKMAAVRHLGIVMTSFMTIRVEYLVISWVCSTFIRIKYSDLKILKFLFFSDLAGIVWPRPLFKCFFWEFDPLNVVGRRADPKKAHPCVIPRNLSHRASKSADGSLQ